MIEHSHESNALPTVSGNASPLLIRLGQYERRALMITVADWNTGVLRLLLDGEPPWSQDGFSIDTTTRRRYSFDSGDAFASLRYVGTNRSGVDIGELP